MSFDSERMRKSKKSEGKIEPVKERDRGREREIDRGRERYMERVRHGKRESERERES